MKITIEHLGMTYDNGTRALDDVNLEFTDGLYALIGLNASGKSTLIRILATLLKPTGGQVRFNGYDLAQNRAQIRAMTGYMPQRFSTFSNTTAWDFLDYCARLAGLHNRRTRKDEVSGMMTSLGLAAVRDKNANGLSPVQKRHLEIAQAMIGRPRIILMDEPTVGLSPEERIRFRQLLVERSKAAEVTLFATHILTDIAGHCSGVAILDKGSLALFGKPAEAHEYIEERGWPTKFPKEKAASNDSQKIQT